MPPDPESGRIRGNWTVPNLLTVLRIVFTPVFLSFYLDAEYVLALGVFAACGLTDALDGLLARLLDQRTRLGAMLDPLADKALLVTAFICLAGAGWLPSWLAVAVASRDAIILGGVGLLAASGRDMAGSIRPSLVSKATTALQMTTVLAAFAVRLLGLPAGFVEVLAWVTGLFTALSGADYVLKGMALFPAGEDGQGGKGRS